MRRHVSVISGSVIPVNVFGESLEMRLIQCLKL